MIRAIFMAVMMTVGLATFSYAETAAPAPIVCEDPNSTLQVFMDTAKAQGVPMIVVQGEKDLKTFDEVVQSEKPTVIMPAYVKHLAFTIKSDAAPEAAIPVAVFEQGGCFVGEGNFQKYILEMAVNAIARSKT